MRKKIYFTRRAYLVINKFLLNNLNYTFDKSKYLIILLLIISYIIVNIIKL